MDKLSKIYEATLINYNIAKQCESLDEDALYFVTDIDTKVKSIYRGAHKIGGDFLVVDGNTPINPEPGIIYYISQFTGKREEEEEEHMPIHFIGYYDPNKTDHKGHKGDWVRMVKDFVIINGHTPAKPEPNVLYYISEYNHDDEGDPYHFLGFYDEAKQDWVYAAHDWTKTITDLQDNKQKKLTAGHGIEIEDDGTINTTIDVTLYKFVEKLPDAGDPTIEANKIYIVETVDASGNVELYEYMYQPDTQKWLPLGKNHSQIDLSDYYTQKQCDDKFMPKSGRIALQPTGGTNPTIDLLTTGSDGFQALRKIESGSITGKKMNGAAFGVKLDGTASFLHKTYDNYDINTGTKTNASNSAVITFSGPSGLRYAKNSKSGGDVADSDYKYVGVIDSPDERQCVYSKKQVDDLLAPLINRIAALEAKLANTSNS